MFHRPQSTAEALALLALDGATILAGGTDVFPALVDRPPPTRLVDISGLPDLRGVRRDGGTVHRVEDRRVESGARRLSTTDEGHQGECCENRPGVHWVGT